jgi:2',3'-cyclic-nucleotide 2'-phosphodiesterase (5'-nucleotidase family)
MHGVLSVETTGAAFVPILNALDYNLYLPGNWEVIYGRRETQTLMLKKSKTNMYKIHDLGDGKRGNLFFNPYIWNVAASKIVLGYTDPLVP